MKLYNFYSKQNLQNKFWAVDTLMWSLFILLLLHYILRGIYWFIISERVKNAHVVLFAKQFVKIKWTSSSNETESNILPQMELNWIFSLMRANISFSSSLFRFSKMSFLSHRTYMTRTQRKHDSPFSFHSCACSYKNTNAASKNVHTYAVKHSVSYLYTFHRTCLSATLWVEDN